MLNQPKSCTVNLLRRLDLTFDPSFKVKPKLTYYWSQRLGMLNQPVGNRAANLLMLLDLT